MGEKVNGGANGGRRWQRQMQEDAMADENGKKSVEEWKKELEALVKEENWEALIERAFNYSIAHPNRPEGYHYEICALMGQKKFQNAIEVAERALKRNATNNTILYNYGQSLYELGRHQRAVIIFSSLIVQIDRDSKRPNYLNFRGSCKFFFPYSVNT